MATHELEFVEWLRAQQESHPAVPLGIGDDMAIVETPAGRLLMSSDMLLDGVHFDTTRHSLSDIGRKAIACSLSDCAAMAVRPLGATVSVALPADFPMDDARELYRGMQAIAAEYELAIVGGDTTTWDQRLAIDVSITAVPYEGIEPVTRSGARLGDELHVTGQLGGSLSGRHLSFTPRVHEAHALGEALGDRLHAMIDISDGLSLDLWRMCLASGTGATLDEGQLESIISDAATLASSDGRTPLDHALSDGEDFELLLAVEGGTRHMPGELHMIGRTTQGGMTIARSDGQEYPVEPKGFVH